jgi:L-fucose isomerase-like protein
MSREIPDGAASLVKLGLLFLGRKRPGFDPAWGARMEQQVRAAVASTVFEVVEPPEKVVDDPSLRRALDGFRQSGVETVVALQTTMADARMAPTLAQLWRDPILLWATPENPQGDLVSSCSLVGLHTWASILRQMDHPFELVYGHPDEEDTLTRLEGAVRIAATCRRLGNTRVGLVGGQAPGFFAMSADPFDVYRGLGVQVQSFSLTEFADVVDGFGEPQVQADVERVKALGLEHGDTSDDDLPMASRLYLAMRHYFDEEACDALAVRCWPELPNVSGQWPYLGMARLAEQGRAIACEGDVDGALNALIGEELGLGRCYLSDWLEHDAETITFWHGGAAPWSLCPESRQPGAPRIARHFNSGKPAVVDAVIRPGLPVTICRFWRRQGRYRATACEGETLQPRRELKGTHALVRLDDRDPRGWFDELCHQGMPHHVAVFAGHHCDLLRRFARCAGIEWLAGAS